MLPPRPHKPQLRACSLCNKVGHNRSRCPVRNTDTVPTAPTTPLRPLVKFFVHHTNNTPTRSPHELDLSQPKQNAWNDVKAIAPNQHNISLFHTYHTQSSHSKQELPELTLPTPTPIVVPIAPKEKIILKSKQTLSFFSRLQTQLRTLGASMRDIPQTAAQSLQNIFVLERAVAILVLIAFVAVPVKATSYYYSLKSTADQVVDDSTAGFAALQESTAALLGSNIPSAENSLTDAVTSFNRAIARLNNEHQVLQNVLKTIPVIKGEVESRQKLLTAGQSLALGNAALLRAVEASKHNGQTKLTDRLQILATGLENALPYYQSARSDLSGVDGSALPERYQAPFQEFKTLFVALVHDLETTRDLQQSLQEIFGGQGLRRYLVVFQNPDELRPTGGFLGSFALVDIENGELKNVSVPPNGSYDLRSKLDVFIEPPAPLSLINRRFEFQDANWFPDFRASAEKMLWFYTHSEHVTVDGVIAVNATVLKRVLSLLGPLTLTRDVTTANTSTSSTTETVTLDADNAIQLIQQIVEEGPEKKDRRPKQILTDLTPVIMNRLIEASQEEALPLLLNLDDALKRKEIQAYFTDPDAEQHIIQMGWGGTISATKDNQDYLLIANTNLGGQKSDARITQTIQHQAVIAEDGSVVNTVVITRQHHGPKGEKFYGQTNIDYLRVYVPEGSELLSASGFTWPDENAFRAPESWYTKDASLDEIERSIGIDSPSGTHILQQFGKTAFGNWIITEPGETSKVQFTYRLPFHLLPTTPTSTSLASWKTAILGNTLTTPYQLVVQKQSGIDSAFESQIVFPNTWHSAWADGNDMQLAQNGAQITTTLTTDAVWSLVMKQTQP